MKMPKDANKATITSHVSNDAKFAYVDYRLALRRIGIDLTSHEIFQRIMLGTSKKHIELVLVNAIMQLSDAQLEATLDRPATFYISPDARLNFDVFVALVQRRRSSIKYGKQVVQGLCLALERPDVRDPLLALMQSEPASPA